MIPLLFADTQNEPLFLSIGTTVIMGKLIDFLGDDSKRIVKTTSVDTLREVWNFQTGHSYYHEMNETFINRYNETVNVRIFMVKYMDGTIRLYVLKRNDYKNIHTLQNLLKIAMAG